MVNKNGEGSEGMEWFLLVMLSLIVLTILGLTHYNGYNMGYKDGFELGKEKINEYALKVNEAQNERIKELQSHRTSDINKLARFFTGDIKK